MIPPEVRLRTLLAQRAFLLDCVARLRALATCALAILVISCAESSTPPVELAPTIDVIVGSDVQFSMIQGGVPPAARQLQIRNSGGGSLAWSATTDVCWVGLAPTSGVAGATLNISVQPECQSGTGNFSGRVSISVSSATNSPRHIPVTLGITPRAVIGLSSDTLAQALAIGDSAYRAVAVRNDGGSVLTWTASTQTGLIRLLTASGTAPDSLRLRLYAGSIEGGFTDSVIVSGSAGAVSKRILVQWVVGAPRIAVSAASLSVGLAPLDSTTRPLVVRNTGVGRLAWSASHKAAWIRLSRASGEASATGDTIIVSMSAKGVPDGVHRDTIVIGSALASNSPVRVPVTLTVGTPKLAVNSSQLGATIVPADSIFRGLGIRNDGGGTLQWTASVSGGAPWLRLTSTSGVAPETINVLFRAGQLAEGTYRDSIVLLAPGAIPSRLVVPAVLTVARPQLQVFVPQFTVAEASPRALAPRLIEVRNVGGLANVPWTATNSASWLQLSARSGLTDGSVTLTVQHAGLLVGTHRDTIVFTAAAASNSPLKIPVVLTVLPKPTFSAPSLATIRAVVGSPTQVANINLQNTGGDSLTWTSASDATWLSISPASGSIAPSGFRAVTVSAAVGSLAAGAHNGKLTLSSTYASNSPYEIPVSAIMAPPRNYDGTWRGTMGTVTGVADTAVTLTVSGNKVTNISFDSPGTLPSCSAQATYPAVSTTTSVDISAGYLERTFAHSNLAFGHLSYTIIGTFASEAQVSGTITIYNAVGVCRSNRTMNWRATRAP